MAGPEGCPTPPGQCGCAGDPRLKCPPYGAPFGGYHIPNGSVPIVAKPNGMPLGAPLKDPGGNPCKDPSVASKFLCWLDETVAATAIAAGATVTLVLQVKWWFQIQRLINVGDQTALTFALTSITYGQSTYFLAAQALVGSTVNGVAYGNPRGVDIRKFNITAFSDHFYPFPACALDDAITVVYTNNNAGAQDFRVLHGGPAVLQIG